MEQTIKNPWRVSARASEPGVGEVTLYGQIGESFWSDGVSEADFRKELDALGDVSAIHVYVNSPGGAVDIGIAIYNQLRAHPARVTVHVEGVAASAASAVCMAGDEIIMPRGAQMMIHNTQTSARGDWRAIDKALNVLKRHDAQLADIYTARTGQARDDVIAMMAEETWLTGEEALDLGFCDKIDESAQPAACADAEAWFARYEHPPVLPTATDNGGESQPAADIAPENPALDAQRRKFWLLRTKMMEGLV